MNKPIAKGKVSSRIGNAQLNESDVRMIRQLGVTQSVRQLAEIYCVGMETVRKILRRDSWKWVSDEINFDEPVARLTPVERMAADASLERLQKLLLKEPVEAPGHAKLAQVLAQEQGKVTAVDQHLDALRSPLYE
jgi:hypothetical protein